MSKHQQARISTYVVTCTLPKLCYLKEPLHCTSIYATGENYKTQRVQREHCQELEQHKMSKKGQSLLSWEAPKHYLFVARHGWPLSMLRKSMFSFYRNSKMLQGCCFTPGIMALEEVAREAGQNCSFCRATTMLLSVSVCLYYRSTSAFSLCCEDETSGLSLAPAVEERALACWDFDCATALQALRPSTSVCSLVPLVKKH